MVLKAPENSTEFPSFLQSHLKKLPKSSQFYSKSYNTTVAALKIPQKAPEKFPNSGDISIWRQLCREAPLVTDPPLL